MNWDLRLIYIGDLVGNGVWASFNLGGLMLTTQIGAGVGGFGLLIGAYGLGSLVGNFATGNLGVKLPTALIAKSAWLGIGLGFVALGFSPSLPWAIAASALAGAFGSMAHVSRAVYLRETVPTAHLGKVYSLIGLTNQLTFALGTLAVGILLERFPTSYVVAGAGLVMMLCSAAILLAGRRVQRALAA
jgi:MFS family permease